MQQPEPVRCQVALLARRRLAQIAGAGRIPPWRPARSGAPAMPVPFDGRPGPPARTDRTPPLSCAPTGQAPDRRTLQGTVEARAPARSAYHAVSFAGRPASALFRAFFPAILVDGRGDGESHAVVGAVPGLDLQCVCRWCAGQYAHQPADLPDRDPPFARPGSGAELDHERPAQLPILGFQNKKRAGKGRPDEFLGEDA